MAILPLVRRAPIRMAILAFAALVASAAWVTSRGNPARPDEPRFDDVIASHAAKMLEDGRHTFRFDTFGDEAFWGDALQLHKAIAGVHRRQSGHPARSVGDGRGPGAGEPT